VKGQAKASLTRGTHTFNLKRFCSKSSDCYTFWRYLEKTRGRLLRLLFDAEV
jgi:hypothetical protein